MAVEIITSFIQQCDSAGAPMSGARVYVYDVETTTLRTVYSDPDLAVGNTAANPIICDSAGRHAMRYTATGSYKVVVKTSADVTVYTNDNIDGRVPLGAGALSIANGGTGQQTAGAALTALGGATAAELADVTAELASLSGTLASTEKTHIATGTTAQRAAAPIEGDIRRNTTIPQWEGYVAAWETFITSANFASQSVVNAMMPTGSVVNSTTATYTENSDITTVIPFDDTIPQVTEGDQIISTTHTPATATNKLRIRFSGAFSASGAVNASAALFINGGANAVDADCETSPVANYINNLNMEYEYVPGATTAVTVSVRAGPDSGTIRFNGLTSGRKFGGVMGAQLVIEEIKAS